jgi:hypothetical protein
MLGIFEAGTAHRLIQRSYPFASSLLSQAEMPILIKLWDNLPDGAAYRDLWKFA